MAKKVTGYIKLQIPAAKATPAERNSSASPNTNNCTSFFCVFAADNVIRGFTVRTLGGLV